jgi:hypothetical protein
LYTVPSPGSRTPASADAMMSKYSDLRHDGIGGREVLACSIASSENFSIGYLSKNDRTRLPERVSDQTNAPGQVSRHVSRNVSRAR